MSGKLVSMVYEREVNHAQQSILVAMADHADDDGRHCFPSVPFIAWKTGYSQRQVQRCIGELRQIGCLLVEREATRYRPTEYRIVLAALPAKEPFAGADKLSNVLRREVIATFQPVCQYCGAQGDAECGPDGRAWEIDRVLPSSAGGRYEPGNVTLSCSTCNKRRNDRRGVRMAPLAVFRGATHVASGVPFEASRGAIAVAPEPSVGTVKEPKSAADLAARPAKRPTRAASALGPGAQAYRDECHLTPNHVQREMLDAAADRFGEERVRTICRQWMARGFKPTNVDAILDVIAQGWRTRDARSDLPRGGQRMPDGSIVIDMGYR